MPINEIDAERFFEWLSADRYSDLSYWFESLGSESKKALINSKCDGQTALDKACRSSDYAKVEWLLQNKANINMPSNGMFPINVAIRAEKFDKKIFDRLVEALKKESGQFTIQFDADFKGPLNHAIRILNKDMRYECFTSLMQEGASISLGGLEVNIKEYEILSGYHSPLIEAIMISEEQRDDKVFFPLLYHARSKCSIFESASGVGNSLYVAAQNGYIYAAKVIIAKAKELGVLQELINNENGNCSDIAKVARASNHNDFAEWIEGEKLPNPHINDDRYDNTDSIEALAAYEAWDPDLDSIIPRDTQMGGVSNEVNNVREG